jgi:thiol-disulfide isomerase/thioredoxin
MAQSVIAERSKCVPVTLVAPRGQGRRWAGLAALCLAPALLACGCASPDVIEIKDPEQFQHVVVESNQPVLVDFYKDGCPPCVALVPTLEKLAKEYEGRAKVAKFKIMTSYWTFPYWELKKKYQIYYVPEVLLFNKGVEVRRWRLVYGMDPYREELDKLVAPAGPASQPVATTRPGPPASSPPSKTPATKPVRPPAESVP